jgi:anti-sigma B factor antagonist
MMLHDGKESALPIATDRYRSHCLDVRIRFDRSLPLVRLSGELDVSSAHLVRDAVASSAAAACPSATVVVDLERVTFCDVAGLRALEDAALALAGDGHEMVLYHVPPTVSRVISLAGVSGLLNVHGGMAEA